MLQSALDHYRRQQRFTAAALIASRRKVVTPPELARTVAAIQLLAARDSLESIDPMLDEQNIKAAPVGKIAATSFAGTASDGRPLESLFSVANGPGPLGLMVITQIQDAARQAAAVSIAARPHIGYVRMLNPPSCSRCAVLAGKFYKYNAGFQRHARCDCRHIPASEDSAGSLTTRPDVYFDSLSKAEQDRAFTNAGAEAIRQGADISQVVNARRGMSTAQSGRQVRDQFGNFSTTAGTSSRSVYGRSQVREKVAGNRYTTATRIRQMPETILEAAKDRADAQRLLRLYGYIT